MFIFRLVIYLVKILQQKKGDIIRLTKYFLILFCSLYSFIAFASVDIFETLSAEERKELIKRIKHHTKGMELDERIEYYGELTKKVCLKTSWDFKSLEKYETEFKLSFYKEFEPTVYKLYEAVRKHPQRAYKLMRGLSESVHDSSNNKKRKKK